MSGLRSRLIVVTGIVLLSAVGGFARPRFHRSGRPRTFTATAYSVSGTTADGSTTQRGKVAADPSVIPLGSKIRIRGAGKYSGVYIVNDTGPKVNGRAVDIYVPDEAAAKRFGKKDVTVQILNRADQKKEVAARQ